MNDNVPRNPPRKPDLIVLRDAADSPPPLIDSFQRRITYLRLSVTDRCDLRCSYCMPERMTFLPKKDVLSLEELYDLATGFIARGVTKIRITGGEPLVRRDIIDLFAALGRRLGQFAQTEFDHLSCGHFAERHPWVLIVECAYDFQAAGKRCHNR
mgnify:CR=1 FL=1